MLRSRFPVILFLLLTFCISCKSVTESQFLAADVGAYHGQKITAMTLKDGSYISFDSYGARYNQDVKDSVTSKRIVGFDLSGKSISFPLDRVLEVNTESVVDNGGGTVLAVILGSVVLWFSPSPVVPRLVRGIQNYPRRPAACPRDPAKSRYHCINHARLD